MRIVLVLFIGLLTVSLLAGCGGGDGDATPRPAATAAGQAPAAPPPAADGVAARTVEVDLRFYYFSPGGNDQGVEDPLYLKVGEPVQFDVTSLDSLHTFEIEELGVNVSLTRGGATKTTQVVTPTNTGTFVIWCGFHSTTKGMVGKVIVTETGEPPV